MNPLSCSPVAHYTLAHIYLGLRDYVSASLHLRKSLQAQPTFTYALSSLKMVRCSLKFKEEQLYLRQKMREEEQAVLRKQEQEIMEKLKKAVQSGEKLKRTSQPAIVVENKEPPEIPEMKMHEAIASPYTGEDAIRYLQRLSLPVMKKEKVKEGGGEREQEAEKGGEKGDEKDKSIMKETTDTNTESGIDSGLERTEVESDKDSSSGTTSNEDKSVVTKVEESDPEKPQEQAPQDSSSDENGTKPASQTTKKPRKKKKKKRKAPEEVEKSWEEEHREIYEQIQRDTMEVIKEAAATINRNQTPITREAKAYTIPARPRFNKGKKTPIKLKPQVRPAVTIKDSEKSKGDAGPVDDAKDKKDVLSVENAPPTTNGDSPPASKPVEGNVKATPTDEETPPTNVEEDKSQTVEDITPQDDKISSTDDAQTSGEAPPTEDHTPAEQPRPRKRRTREEIREEEIKKRYPGTRAWPTLEECEAKKLPKTVVFTSTWLSVTAKGVNVKDHMDFKSPVTTYNQMPYCHNDFEPSKKTLSHLTGMNNHPLIQYKAEKGLQEVLCTLDGLRRPLDEMSSRIKVAMDKDPGSWVLSNLAALYWRIVGQGQLAIRCLKHALYYSDKNARDVALVSLANVLYRSGYDIDAAVVIHMSLENSPTLVVNHFTMANILAAQGLFVEAAGFYESTLHYQPEFQPADDRLRIVRCLILKANKHSSKNNKQKKEID